jgi:hypothetical protein
LITFLFLWNKNKKPKCHFFDYFSLAFRLLTNTPKTPSPSPSVFLSIVNVI